MKINNRDTGIGTCRCKSFTSFGMSIVASISSENLSIPPSIYLPDFVERVVIGIVLSLISFVRLSDAVDESGEVGITELDAVSVVVGGLIDETAKC